MSTEKKIDVSIKDFFNENREELSLELVSGKEGMSNKISVVEPHHPGLAFAGFTDYVSEDAVFIMGEVENSYLKHISPARRSLNLNRMFEKRFPCMIMGNDIPVSKILKMLSNKYSIPMFSSKANTNMLFHRTNVYLSSRLAPSITFHGTLVDIYGIGVLISGKSGIGKSECALDLIDRGHRLVADDAIKIFRRGEHILMGTGIAPDSALQYHMEVRGVGILDISKIFGIRGVRLHKRIEIEINLIEWKMDTDVERVGLKEETTKILDVEIPLVKIPLIPGKNVSVIAEVVALNHLLKISGYDTAKVFNATLIKLMQEKAKKLARLDEDVE
ncbi:TPA: HPr(Ser) kinase/phosphatase [candidate division WOR-3 bacterium]|jgi:HPr kinase/phosphorylase|uniref:HPr kinase/phosphorylase n=1 Tax=candidate division WOR-3 bacterium TaxID=2052148 RepID=A0A350HC27_UNCW3|nr:HPr(Ser) kinase/phosphatase [candidate division WOR-3 bacterium]